jgi:hypothetical protein
MKPELNRLNGKQLQRRPARHLLPWCWLPLCLTMVGAGCSPQAKVAADINPAGTYTLVSVDGNKVPCTLTHEGVTPTIKSGVFIINPDGTCSSKMVFSLPSSDDTGREVKATYTRQGSTLTMQWEGAGITMGSVEGDTFTMTNEGMVLAYRK